MDKIIADIAKALKESQQSLGVCLEQTLDVLQNHECRLQALEKWQRERELEKLSDFSLKRELKQLERRIDDLSDPAKREAAMAEFAILCNVLGVEDLEAMTDE